VQILDSDFGPTGILEPTSIRAYCILARIPAHFPRLFRAASYPSPLFRAMTVAFDSKSGFRKFQPREFTAETRNGWGVIGVFLTGKYVFYCY
jgi:hypothetical protein